MKYCQTCGKILNSSSEEFTVNGMLQCEECAYPNKQNYSTQNNAQFKEVKKINNGWSTILKAIGKISIIAGSAASILLGICVYKLVYGSTAVLLSFGIIIIGVILSVVSSSLLMTFAEIGDNISVIRHIEENKNNKI